MTTRKKVKMCSMCEKQKSLASFYSTNSKMFTDGKVPICKPCIAEQIDENDIDSVKRILRQIDKPFIQALWNSSVESDRDTFGVYMKNINSLPQYKSMTYDNSVEIVQEDDEEDDDLDIDELETEDGTIKITKDVKVRFGSGYKNEEYIKMEKFYRDMRATHDITQPQHIEMLVEICKVNIEKDRALKERNAGDYKKLSDASKTLLADAGFRPADKVSGSEATGIRTFSQIFEEIEKDGFIVPAKIEVHQDVLDRTIMYMQNYTRRLLNMDVLVTPLVDEIEQHVRNNKGEEDE